LEDQEGDGRDYQDIFSGVSHEDGSWMEVAHDHIQWWALVLAVLNHQILLL